MTHPLLENYFNFFKRYLPSKSHLSSIALDIGTADCKCVEIRPTEKSYMLLNWAVEPVGEKLEDTLRTLLSHFPRFPKILYTSVFGKGTLIRYVKMPRMSLKDLRNSSAIEADKYFPFSQDQIYRDCYILDPQGKEKQMSVIMAAAKKELIDERIKLLSQLSIEADFIGINALAVTNAFNVLSFPGREKEKSAVALLDMGHSSSNLTIILEDLPQFSRDIFVGGQDFTKSISNAFAIDYSQAEALKKEPKDRLEEVTSVCESAVMNIIQELRISFDYFTTEHSSVISDLLITGGGSKFENISEFFKQNLEVEVHKWDPLSSLEISEQMPIKDLKNYSPQLGVALGLALFEYDSD